MFGQPDFWLVKRENHSSHIVIQLNSSVDFAVLRTIIHTAVQDSAVVNHHRMHVLTFGFKFVRGEKKRGGVCREEKTQICVGGGVGDPFAKCEASTDCVTHAGIRF